MISGRTFTRFAVSAYAVMWLMAGDVNINGAVSCYVEADDRVRNA